MKWFGPYRDKQNPALVRRILRSSFWVVVLPYGWVFLFFLVPFLIVLKISFSELQIALPPYGPLFEWVNKGVLLIKLDFTNYQFIGTDSLYVLSYLDSFGIALLGTLGCLVIGYPMAYGISKTTGHFRVVFLMLVVLPFWTSFLLRVYSWIGILSPHGFLNTALLKLGLITDPLIILNTTGATLIGIVYCYLPFMILPLYSSLEKIDTTLMEAAYDLGARPFKVFLKIILPLSMPGILSGSTLVLIPAVGEFVIPELLGGSQTLMIGKILWNEFFTNHDWPVASALAVILLIVLILPLGLFQRSQARSGRM